VAKRNRTKEKATLIACLPKAKLFNGVDENSLRSDTHPLIPSNSLIFGGDKMGMWGRFKPFLVRKTNNWGRVKLE